MGTYKKYMAANMAIVNEILESLASQTEMKDVVWIKIVGHE